MERGYVRLYRKKLLSDLWQNPAADRLFEYLMLSVTYRPLKYFAGGTCIELQPGEYISSIRNIAKGCVLSIQQTRTALTYLKSTQRVAQRVTRRYSVFSIINWVTYQDPENYRNTLYGTDDNTLSTQYQHTVNTLPTQKQEVKELKELKEEDQRPEPRRAKKPSPVFVLPDSIRPEVWEAFEEHRRKKRSPMTDHARELTVKECEKIGGDPNELLEQAILKGWQTVYPTKDGRNGKGSSYGKPQISADGRELKNISAMTPEEQEAHAYGTKT